jgi:ABC-type methionine transport system ATPase subunit
MTLLSRAGHSWSYRNSVIFAAPLRCLPTFLQEPLEGKLAATYLDPELVSEVLNIVRDLASEGMTMLLATHEMGFAREVSSKVCFLCDGAVYEEGPPEQIFGDPTRDRTRAFLKSIREAKRI